MAGLVRLQCLMDGADWHTGFYFEMWDLSLGLYILMGSKKGKPQRTYLCSCALYYWHREKVDPCKGCANENEWEEKNERERERVLERERNIHTYAHTHKQRRTDRDRDTERGREWVRKGKWSKEIEGETGQRFWKTVMPTVIFALVYFLVSESLIENVRNSNLPLMDLGKRIRED